MSALPSTVPTGDDLVARALSVPTRAAIYRELRRAGRPRSAREMGERVGVHANVARTHLDVLVEAGLVLAGSRHNPLGGRPAKVYAAREQHVDAVQPPRAVNAGEVLGLHTALQLVAGLREHVARAGLLAEEQGRRLVTARGGRATSRPLDTAVLFVVEALEPAFPSIRAGRDEADGYVLDGVREQLGLIAEVDPALADAIAAGLVRGALVGAGGAATAEAVDGRIVVRAVGDGMLPLAATTIDARGRSYDRGVVQAMRAVGGLRPGAHLEVLTDAAGAPAAYARWADRAGHRIVAVDRVRDVDGRPAVRILIRKAAGR
jgi:DNA-binding transcriptional ArsR family regulator/TusA-related sulfurtransferase